MTKYLKCVLQTLFERQLSYDGGMSLEFAHQPFHIVATDLQRQARLLEAQLAAWCGCKEPYGILKANNRVDTCTRIAYIVVQSGVGAMAMDSKVGDRSAEGVTLDTLIDKFGKGAAEEFFGRIDGSLRIGGVIHGTNVRESRVAFSKARQDRHAQFVVPGRASDGRRGAVDVGDSVVVMKMDDFQAVILASRNEFDWGKAFAPHGGLAPATSSVAIVRGAHGARILRA